MRGDRIVTEPVDVIYKQIKDRECINSDIISIRKCRSYIEADPISIFDSLSYLYGVEVYDDNDELMNSMEAHLTNVSYPIQMIYYWVGLI